MATNSTVIPDTIVEKPEDADKKKLSVLESHGYTIGRTIGSGSYAKVKVAFSEKHDSTVAVKIISKFEAPPDYIRKFLRREIDVVKGLQHVSLIRFMEAIETTHRVYIVMEYAENGSLLDVIRRDGYIDEIRSRHWFTQLVDGVEYCHNKGIVHRDIKCDNMLLDSHYNIKLSDFGFARGHMLPKNGKIILSDTFCGSYAYASPEILQGIPYQPQMSDIWSMGVVLYAMVFGRLPFDDTHHNQLLKQVLSKIIFPKDPKVTHSCKSLITKILSPLRTRLRMPGIRNDPWMLLPTEVRRDSSGTSQESRGTSPKLVAPKPSKERAPVKLVTKEVLESAASQLKEDIGLVTDEEVPLGTVQRRDNSDLSSGHSEEEKK